MVRLLCAGILILDASVRLERQALQASEARLPDAALRFSVVHHEGFDWFLAPSGARFFSRGVCCVHQGTPREADDPENPSYAAWRHYESPAAWAEAASSRLRSWGFTTIGAWSDFATLRPVASSNQYFAPVLHIGSTAGAPWWDMWDPKNIRRMEQVAREAIGPVRGDPRVIGYFSDNELGWWNATLWKMTLEQPASSGQRQRLVQLLRRAYQDDWQRLLADFEPENARNWAQLERGGMLYLKSGGQGIHTMRRFLGLLADRYYQLMREIIRREDPGALFLGDRYQSFFYPEVVRAAARYVDVISSNLNVQWRDGTFLRCYLDTLHALTGKPVLVSEFYLAAAENRSGNRNSAGIFPVAATQSDRAAAARTTLEMLVRLPYAVGADWFQLHDEPTHGRDDGENFNFGLVDIHDRPYEELTAMFAAIDPAALRAGPVKPRLDATSGVPPAPPDPFANFRPREALLEWDRERGYITPAGAFAQSDLYVCWKPEALYLGLYSQDIVEPAYYRGAWIPKQDRAVWTVSANGRDVVRARIGAGREPLWNEPRVRVENSSGVSHHVSNIAALEIPAALLGEERLQAGDTVALRVTLQTYAGAQRTLWYGRYTLR